MGLELDSLESDNTQTVIHNNTTGEIINFCGFDDFVNVLKRKFGVIKEEIPSRFSFEELEDFFINHYLDEEEDMIKLDELFKNNKG